MIEADPVLGKALTIHPASRARLLIPAWTVVGVGAVILNYTLATVEGWGPPLTVIVMAALALGAGWYVLHFWNREVVLYEGGFSYREGANTVFFRYDDIRSLRQRGEQLSYFGGLIRRSAYRVTLTTTRDERIVLTNLYSHIDKLSARLEEKVNAVLKPQIEARLMNGEKVPFTDTLRLSQNGLHEQGRDLPWEAFGGYQVGGGRLRLFDQSGSEWFSLPLHEVDNIALLVALLRERITQ